MQVFLCAGGGVTLELAGFNQGHHPDVKICLLRQARQYVTVTCIISTTADNNQVCCAGIAPGQNLKGAGPLPVPLT